MPLCRVVDKCDLATVHDLGSAVLSVGIKFHGDERFVTICMNDSLTGCQHVRTKGRGPLAIIEAVSRALSLAEF